MKHAEAGELQRARTLHLFAGAGGGILADLLLGHQPVCAVEIDDHCQQVLSARQKDGSIPWFPIFGDVKEFNGHPWRGLVDIIAGGFPCQDISTAGRGAGISGSRSGLWSEFARIICEVRPAYVFVENSPVLLTRGIGTVLGDLAEMGFDARWGVLGAVDVGAPMQSDRLWIVAKTNGNHGEKRLRREFNRPQAVWSEDERRCEADYIDIGLEATARVAGVPDGMADWLDRTRAIGNGQVPQCAAEAWRILTPGARQ